MNTRPVGTIKVVGFMATAALVIAGAVFAQVPDPVAKEGNSKGAGSKTKSGEKPGKGGLRAPGGAPPKKFRKNVADPFVNPVMQGGQANNLGGNPVWPYHYQFKLTSFDGTSLASAYYPAQRPNAPVVLLVHEKGRSEKDFEDEIEGLKNRGLADYLQTQGLAILLVDLRGHGANQRKEIAPKDGPVLIRDLQAAYQFLVDRHNREEINLSKFGVVALGEGANVVANWAATQGGAVSSEGRISDLGALVLISPVSEGFGLRLSPALAAIAPRIPVFLMAGERDLASLNPVKDAQPIVGRQRQSKVEFFPTSLHGYKLLRFQAKVPDAIVSFFEATIKKLRLEDWEPRYNLAPVAYGDIELVRRKPGEAKKGLQKFDPEPKAKADDVEKKAPADAGKEAEKKTAGDAKDADKKANPEGKDAAKKAPSTKDQSGPSDKKASSKS